MATKKNVNRKNLEKFFDFENENAKCKLCSHVLKSDRLFNLKTHILKVHKINEVEFSYEANCLNRVDKNIRKRVIKVEINKKQLFRSYVGLITEDNLPLRVLDSDNLKNIVEPICKGLSEKIGKKITLNSSNCKEVLKSVADSIRQSITNDLNQRLMSLKIDSATRLSRNIFGISAQFIKGNLIQSRLLGMIELKGSGASRSRNLATEIINTLSKHNISLHQIVSITSDNGTNMLKCTKILSHCTAIDEENDDNDIEEGNDKYLKNIEYFEKFKVLYLGDIQICRCAAHTAQLCALDVMKDSEIKSFILSCRNLTKFIRKQSNGYREIFELKNLAVPQLDCPTRWGSSYNMVKSLKNAKDVLIKMESVRNKSSDENFELNDNFWEFIEAYYVAFEPLQVTIIKFQQEQLNYGNFYAEWLKCRICTKKVLETNNTLFVDKIVKSLLDSMERRSIKLLENEILLSCLYLDPRFNHILTAAQKLQATTYLKKLYERLQGMTNNIGSHINAESLSSSAENNQYSQKADEFLSEYLFQNFPTPTKDNIDVRTKIDNLQLPLTRVDIDILHFWKDRQFSDPELYALSNICFAVPPTQVTIERAFSSLKLILSDNRSRLSEDTLENILLVKLNAEFLDNAINGLPLFEDDD